MICQNIYQIIKIIQLGMSNDIEKFELSPLSSLDTGRSGVVSPDMAEAERLHDLNWSPLELVNHRMQSTMGARDNLSKLLRKPALETGLLERLRDEYVTQLNFLSRIGFVGDNEGRGLFQARNGLCELPDFDRILASFERWQLELAAGFDMPRLVLEPYLPLSKIAEVLNMNRAEKNMTANGENDSKSITFDEYFRTKNTEDRLRGLWRAWIVEGAKIDVDSDGRQIFRNYSETIYHEKSGLPGHITHLDPQAYALFVKRSELENFSLDPGLIIDLGDVSGWIRGGKLFVRRQDGNLHFWKVAHCNECQGKKMIRPAVGGQFLGELKPEMKSWVISSIKSRFKKKERLISWSDVEKALKFASPATLLSLYLMEATGGKPNVLNVEGDTIIFCDHVLHASGLRKPYDDECDRGWTSLRSLPTVTSQLGVDSMDELQYRLLHKQGGKNYDSNGSIILRKKFHGPIKRVFEDTIIHYFLGWCDGGSVRAKFCRSDCSLRGGWRAVAKIKMV
jgi:hypothetical protein